MAQARTTPNDATVVDPARAPTHENRYLVIMGLAERPQVYEALELEDGDGGYEYRFRPQFGTVKRFRQDGATFRFYTRTGVYLVIGLDVTPWQFRDVVERLKTLSHDALISFAKERALTPPE
jgi:hypothetical protein